MDGAIWNCCRLGAFSIWTPYTHAPCHCIQNHIHKVHSVTCHQHLWQNDRDLLRDTAVTRGWNGYQNKSRHEKLTLEKNILQPLPRTRTRDLSITSPALWEIPVFSCLLKLFLDEHVNITILHYIIVPVWIYNDHEHNESKNDYESKKEMMIIMITHS